METSRKQKQAYELAINPQITELLLGGSAGGSKSWTVCQICVLMAKLYPGVRIFIGRRTLKSLKQSTIATLINKVHPALGVLYDDYRLRFSDMELEYKNGSKIIFGELEYIPSDEDYSRWGSMECDFGVIEEAGEIAKQGFSVIKSRSGRGILAKEYGIPGFVILTCNPSQNFLKTEFYDPYEKLGGGGFQKWAIGEVTLDEGKPTERKVPAYRAFLRMGAYDNPFLPQSYIDNLKSLPERERKRLLDGNWNYADDDNMLFKSGLLDKATTYDLPESSEKFNKYIGCDVADKGLDKTCFTLIDNGVVVTQKIAGASIDKTSNVPIGKLLADELVEFAQRNGFTQRNARNIAIECNGIGSSIRDMMKLRGWYFTEYIATHKSRSENYYQLMLDMDAGVTKLYHEMNGLEDLKKELAAHTYDMNGQVPDVCKKEKIKQVIGHSPDSADSLMIANWVKNYVSSPQDERHNANRIVF